uniref:HTH CENPB-type domain-containing protein n=1 Tax=Oryzias sinensis TaxID=183150 RepID=A0A8C7X5T2_9TELE
MSSLQSLRELISERLAAAAEEIFQICEGTIVKYEQELCRQRRLLDISWKPQLQLHHIVLPQRWVTEKEDLCYQQTRNVRVKHKEPEPQQIKEEQEDLEPPQTEEEWRETELSSNKQESEELCLNQDEDQLDLKQETDTLMEIPTSEKDENSEADLNNQQSFNVTDSQDEAGNQQKESTSTTDEESDQENSDHNITMETLKMPPAKRHAYEAQFKLQVISYAEEHGNRAAARKFNINESMVRNWRKLENKLRQVKKTQLSFRGNKARWPELEDRLVRWINDQRTAGRNVSTVTIRLKASTLADEMKIQHFHGGPSWCFRFMKRHHISIRARTTVVQQLPADYNKSCPSSASTTVKRLPKDTFSPAT